LVWFLAVAGWCFASTALADEGVEERANRFFNQAKLLMAQGDFASAVDDLSKAWTLFSHPLIVKKRAQCHEELGMLEEAIADYETFLTVGRPSASERRELQAHLKTLAERNLKAVPVTVTSLRVGLLVAVGDQEPKRVPFAVSLKPGTVQFAVQDPRFEKTKVSIRIRAVPHQVVSVTGVERLGSVVVASSAGSFEDVAVFIDSRSIPVTSDERQGDVLNSRSVGVGEHLLRCDRGGMLGTAVAFRVVPDTEVRVMCQLPSAPAQSLWFWSAVSVGAASVLTGVALLTSYGLDKAKADDTHQRLISSKPLAGGLVLGAGVAVGVASIFLYEGAPDSVKEEKVAPTVFIQQTENGDVLFGLSGQF